MNCHACGKPIEADSLFCRLCGARQERPVAAAEPAPVGQGGEGETSDFQPLWIIGGLLLVGLLLILAFNVGGPRSPAGSPGPTTNIPDNLAAIEDLAAVDSLNLADGESAPPAPPAEAWTYSTTEDKVRGATSYFASTTSTNSIELDAPYDGGSTLRMTVRQSPAHGADVILLLSSGQLLCRAYDGCHAMVRFDQKPAERVELVEASDNSSDTVFVSDATPFIAKLKKAKRIIVELEIYEAGRPQFEFDVAGLKWNH